jgi:acyl carrier protein
MADPKILQAISKNKGGIMNMSVTLCNTTNDGIAKKIIGIAIETLSIDPEDCKSLDAHIIYDLGAESIDFVDISFRLEKEFGLEKIKAPEIFPFLYYEAEINEEEHSAFRSHITDNYPHIAPHYVDRVLAEGKSDSLFTLEIMHDFVVFKNGVK